MARHTLTIRTLDGGTVDFGGQLALGSLVDGVPYNRLYHGQHWAGVSVLLTRDEWEALGHPHELEVEL